MARGFVDADDPYGQYDLSDIKKSRDRALKGSRSSVFNEKLRDYENQTPFNYAITDDLEGVTGLPSMNMRQIRQLDEPSPNAFANYFESISINDDDDGVPPGPYSPAKPTLVPTSTLDPSRPRTIAAGYNSKTKIMTVIFRDGTWWNYFQVPGTVWNNFKAAYSKGRYLYAHGFDDRYGGAPIRFEGQRAAADVISSEEQRILATRARAVQQHTEGLQPGQTSSGQRKAMKRGYSQNRVGGTARKRARKSS